MNIGIVTETINITRSMHCHTSKSRRQLSRFCYMPMRHPWMEEENEHAMTITPIRSPISFNVINTLFSNAFNSSQSTGFNAILLVGILCGTFSSEFMGGTGRKLAIYQFLLLWKIVFCFFLIVSKHQSAMFRGRYRRSFDEPISMAWRALNASCNKTF